jgi:hypothetical protein
MKTRQELWDELAFRTLARGDAEFQHQLIVDAFAAQEADENTKPITLVFALVGLYLHVERGFTGKQVQRVHMQLARRRKVWPRVELPASRGAISVEEVARVPLGDGRDSAIEEWCASVWEAYSSSREAIARLLREELDIR